MDKTCYKCKESKPLSDFHRNSTKADGYQNYCRVCAKVRNRAYYVATPERNTQRRASTERGRNRARILVWKYLEEHPCVDCGFDNPVALEFDHVRGNKHEAISLMVTKGRTAEALLAEIAKCEVRCANCHRIVTAQRGNWWTPDRLLKESLSD